MKNKLMLIAFLFFSLAAIAQTGDLSAEEKGAIFGKLFAQALIFLGIPIALFLIGRRIRKKKMNNNASN